MTMTTPYTIHPIASAECDALNLDTLLATAETLEDAARLAEQHSAWPWGAGIRETASGRIDVGFGLGVEAPDAEA